ncbi:uncharacterized protein LAESUDRAFT_730763 [Laetiporus sulphureus 93-53]|uniref:Uncharacterized protein n=1 Tax=Laetiporus sulphureus 93-53 TaxID=1314785 RepID=A0A165BYA0_9APHY|nr:uncharacterized protein LAESUDRAFT_730763 [Laetiporus sulphureus 93-53]KZT01868.1 hypothetical protein LAESUDRAFT_730763 [Laetiporus sulphureus 93-53]
MVEHQSHQPIRPDQHQPCRRGAGVPTALLFLLLSDSSCSHPSDQMTAIIMRYIALTQREHTLTLWVNVGLVVDEVMISDDQVPTACQS